MPVLNRIAALAPQMTEWRRTLHRMPELEFTLPKTAAFVAEKLREFGVDELHEGIAGSGMVALIHGRDGANGAVIGLRADMDALPITETTGAEYASEHEGKMHACGHDGHTTMLLGAAAYLAETRNFAGTAALIFQPAEEEGGGADVMVREGIMDRFDIREVYAIHNAPNIEFGEFVTRTGPYMAAVDTVWIDVTGRGGHGAMPQDCIDPVPAMAMMVSALQTITSRNISTNDALVVTVTQIHAGTATNIIPETGQLCLTVRSFDPAIRDLAETRIRDIVAGQAAAFGVTAQVRYDRLYPPTVNDADSVAFAAEVARDVSGKVDADGAREMGAEDFSYMLEARPGAYLFLGTGPGAGLHHPAFDFNDEAAPIGASFFARLIERALPAG
ncbi:M20 aminoacylase family protein [Albirhodobacter sp. R86504]|uniref:M20 aminoacylase family protein n=1 Tax=Albirhodobacter sp. R86504 TaxID=3093848 RepID=UPI00366E26C1